VSPRYAGDAEGRGGIFNFVTKRGLCHGANAKISWTQVETGSAITWKYPSVVLKGDNSVGEFYSVALTNHKQQADTGGRLWVGERGKSRSRGRSEEEEEGVLGKHAYLPSCVERLSDATARVQG